MKNKFYIFLLFSSTLWAQTAFDNGNKLYQNGNYQEAIKSYENLLKSDQQSSELYFNLGNCYYKLNKVAPAIFNFEKALLLNPSDSEIQNNLTFAQKMTIDEVIAVPKVGFSKIIQDFTSVFHYETWAWIIVFLAFAFLSAFLGYYFSNTTFLKRTFFTIMLLVLLLIITSTLAGFYEQNQYENNKPAVIFADVVSVKSEPKSSATDSFVLHAGTKVFVLESLNNYKKIQLMDLKEGWIDKSAIKELK